MGDGYEKWVKEQGPEAVVNGNSSVRDTQMRQESGEEGIHIGWSMEKDDSLLVWHRSNQIYGEQGLVDEGSEVKGEGVKNDVLCLAWYWTDYAFCNMEE